jgi:hypothetical protein
VEAVKSDKKRRYKSSLSSKSPSPHSPYFLVLASPTMLIMITKVQAPLLPCPSVAQASVVWGNVAVHERYVKYLSSKLFKIDKLLDTINSEHL